MKINGAYREAYRSKARYLHLYGGAGSGKSWFAAQKVILRCLQEKGHRFLCLRKVARTLRPSVFQLLRDIIIDEGLGDVVSMNKSEMAFYFPNGSEIVTAGLDDVEKLKSITGITGIWIEEPTEIKQKEDFQQVDLRLRGDTDFYKQIILSYNPIDPLHWLKKEFHDQQRDDTYILQTTYEDNPFIGDEYESVLSSIGGNMQTIYKHGNWGYANAPDQLIKIQWALGMQENEKKDGKQRAGIDVARYGDDSTVFGRFTGNVIDKIKSFEKQSIPETARQAYTFIHQNRIDPKSVGIDIVGYGAGVYDNLEEMGMQIRPVDSGSSPVDTYEHQFYTFNNLRSQMWWYASQQLADGNVSSDLPQDQFQTLVEDLTSVKYIIDDKKIKVQSKDKLKEELGRSPDFGDMFVYGLFVDKLESDPFIVYG